MMMMYILPLLLGRTFDIKNDHVGVDIFPENVILNPTVHKAPTYVSDYKVIRELKDIANFLKIKGELSLKVKAGLVKIGGSGSYLKDHVFRDDVVEVLTSVYFQTEEHSIPASTPPISKWDELPLEDLGTHYVKSIFYGGQLVGSFKFRALDKKDIESIKGSIDGAIGNEDSNKIEVAGKLEKLQKDLEGKASLEISYYATVPLDGVALTLSGYRDLISKFRNQVERINGGRGVPLKVELEELELLNEKFHFEEDKILKSKLDLLEILFDDLTLTRNGIIAWLRDIGSSITEDQEQKIDKLYNEITIISEVFVETIAKLDIEKDQKQLEKAFQAYKRGTVKGIPGKYQKAWENLRLEMIVPEISKTEKTTYIHWGKKKCDSLNSSTIIEGYAASAVEETSPSDILCLPQVPEFSDESADGKEKKVAAARFGLVRLNPFKGELRSSFEHPIHCAVCYVSDRSTVVVLAGQSTCPDGWEKEYEGYYLAGRENSPKSEIICVDINSDKENLMKQDLGKFMMVVTYNSQVIPCIVCSK